MFYLPEINFIKRLQVEVTSVAIVKGLKAIPTLVNYTCKVLLGAVKHTMGKGLSRGKFAAINF